MFDFFFDSETFSNFPKKKHLFSKSWTARVLWVELAEEGGSIDRVVFLRLTRDHLSEAFQLILSALPTLSTTTSCCLLLSSSTLLLLLPLSVLPPLLHPLH